MSMKYFALLTRLGADKLANAAALGTKLEITQMAVGDGGGSLPTPHTTQAQLINERRRAAINVLSIDPKNTHQIIAEQVIPESEGGWWIREIGLFDKDGILIAVGNCAETYKPQLQEGSGRTQTLRMVLIVSSTDAVTLKIDPAVVLATREYVDLRVTNSIKDHENSRRHPDATLKDKGFVILSSAVDSHSETQAATPKAVKVAYDLANAARDNANGRVPATRKVNGKALSSDISLGAGDVGTYTPGEIDSRVNEAKSLANTATQNAANANNNANSRLEKNQNGADIPDPKRFVENLGLSGTVDQAENAYPKTGGQITGKVYADDDIEAKGWVGGTTLHDRHKDGRWSRAYSEAFPPSAAVVGAYSIKEANDRYALKKSSEMFSCGGVNVEATHDWAGLKLINVTGYYVQLSATPHENADMLRILYRDKSDKTQYYASFRKKSGTVALEETLLGIGQNWTDVTSSRRNKATYTNRNDKPIVVYIESNRTGTGNPFSIDITVNGLRVAYRWTDVDEVVSLSAIVPPGATYGVQGGWARPFEWVVINTWMELR
ncbi:phage tail protein [Xenorhabdus aichiensis]|uniref:phage tail protein n=1 Tax=Xenorhabdus aichiensis TaxID=3025874 RepID=UPI00278BBD58|nr:phage tail protein [Xenorhabdus aichiensis]